MKAVLAMEPLISAQARTRQREANRPELSQTFDKADVIHTNTELGKVAGVSHETIRKVKVITTEADDPTKEALREGTLSIQRRLYSLRARAYVKQWQPSPGNPRG
jgi:hypothetical protein